ncbi:MAG: DciA family protein [Xanthomonadales bacterium]|nr:DciA family protein [Xanthomonadales bacterium]
MHAREIDRLNTQLAAVLEPGTGALVQVASIRYDTVVLVTPSAALATRLKLDPAPLLAHLSHKSGRSFSKLEVRVAPLPGNKPADTRKRRQVPVQARAVFERFRSSDDPKEG